MRKITLYSGSGKRYLSSFKMKLVSVLAISNFHTMAWSYKKRIKIIPGIHLNFSKKGISTTIGIKGASVNFSSRGVVLNTGIPALGLYNKYKFGSGANNTTNLLPIDIPEPAPPVNNYNQWPDENIFSLDIEVITSQDMQGVKDTILMAHQQREELQHDLHIVNKELAKSRQKLFFSYCLLYGFILPGISKRIKGDINCQKNAINNIREQITKDAVQLEYTFEDASVKSCYDALHAAYEALTNSHKIWDVTGSHYQNRVAARSAASAVVTRREVSFNFKQVPDIASGITPFYLKNANGSDLYIYPNFILLYSSKNQIAIIGLQELEFSFTGVQFIETGSVPADTQVVDHTWAKVNKNGSPDKRFKDNYQIPIVKYGEIRLQTTTGLLEEYQFSNYQAAAAFSEAFLHYRHILRKIAPHA